MAKYHRGGFSLTEILIVISLIGITACFTANVFGKVLAQAKRYSALNELAKTVLYARNYAVSRHVNVKLCPSDDHKHCQGNWENGSILLANNTLLLSLPALADGHHLYLRAFPYSNHLEFNALGMLNSNNGKFIYILPDGSRQSLVISKTGRIRFSTS